MNSRKRKQTKEFEELQEFKNADRTQSSPKAISKCGFQIYDSSNSLNSSNSFLPSHDYPTP
jgi:hypothetical protein